MYFIYTKCLFLVENIRELFTEELLYLNISVYNLNLDCKGIVKWKWNYRSSHQWGTMCKNAITKFVTVYLRVLGLAAEQILLGFYKFVQ